MSSRSYSNTGRDRTREKGAICFEFERDGETIRGKVHRDRELDKVEQVERDSRHFGDGLPALEIPGSGEEREDCGDAIPALFCECCADVHNRGRTCYQPLCPRCWSAWDYRRATPVAAKLQGYIGYHHAIGDAGRKMKGHHVVFNLRPEGEGFRFDSSDPIERAVELVKELAHMVNIDTGFLIYHPYRIKHEYRGDVVDHESGDGDMTWADLIGEDDWQEYVVHEPHFHVLAASPFVQGGEVTKEIQEQTGVNIERIKKGDGKVSMYDLEDFAAVASYSLSHGGARETENGQSEVVARFFGELHNFEATDDITMAADREVRDAAPRVLGKAFPSRSCYQETEERWSETIETTKWRRLAPMSAAFKNAGRYGTASEAHEPEPGEAEAEIEQETTCGAQLVSLADAPAYLNDSEWVELVGRDAARALVKTYNEAEWIGEVMAPP